MAALDPGPLDLRCFFQESRSAGVVGMLYNGISNRSRDSTSDGLMGVLGGDSKVSRGLGVKRWDGAARIASGWDNLRKDPELWYRNGNCFVHLHEKGQSQREPAFKVPLACLISAKCEPMIERFVDRSITEEGTSQHGRVDLYIPAPPTASRSQALQYHVATRNFFAWVCRRSMVGDFLGNALVALVNSMHDFRDDDADNYQDLLSYLDEEAYLDMSNYPTHAVAILDLAESFHFRDLYIDALAHCVGMSERLYKTPGYSRLSVASQGLIRRARVDLDHRLSHAGVMLCDLLEQELSETHIGLSTGARAHLDRFRTYIHSFYLIRFESFPPPPADSSCNTIFKPEVYREMRADFEALYEYLVDERYDTADNSPQVAQGGLCTLQNVQAFDLRHKLMPLPHPLPLLPAPLKGKESRCRKAMHWPIGTNRTEGEVKLRPDQRLVAHAAVMTATNRTKVHLLANDLVLAYRKFEENFVLTPHKADRAEKLGLSHADARKVRWLFVYATYQTLRSCTEVPTEVKSQDNVRYHLAVSTKGLLLPWEVQAQDGAHPSPRSVSDGADAMEKALPAPKAQHPFMSEICFALPSPIEPQPSSTGIEIKPDIDYYALTHQDENPSRGRSTLNEPIIRSGSITRKISLRRSFSKLRNSSNQHPLTAKEKARATLSHTSSQSNRKSVYHEIIVHGYGNGATNTTDFDKSTERVDARPDLTESPYSPPYLEVDTTQMASRSASTSSSSSYGSESSSPSTSEHSGKSESTTPTTVDGSSCSSRYFSYKWDDTGIVEEAETTGSPEIPITITSDQPEHDTLDVPVRRRSTRKSIRKMFSTDDMPATESKAEAPPLPRRSSKRSDKASASKRWTLIDIVAPLRDRDDSDSDSDIEPSPLRPRKARGTWRRSSPPANADEQDGDIWDGSDYEWEKTIHSAVEVSPPWSWEQYTDLGGLQPASPTL